MAEYTQPFLGIFEYSQVVQGVLCYRVRPKWPVQKAEKILPAFATRGDIPGK